MRGNGINYDTGFMPGNHSRPDFDPAIAAAEIRVIARELGCTAIRITGGDPGRIGVAARAAAAEGLEVWFSPFPVEVQAAGMIGLFGDCADRAEELRRDGAAVVLVVGCELSLFNPGASGIWEPVDWSPFDIVSVDAYRDARNADSFRAELRKRFTHGKPVVATEFGCCGYAGAADRGGVGWDIAEYDEAGDPSITGDYERDESEQVRYLQEVNQVFVEEGLDLAFWFTFAGYRMPVSSDPRRDADLASYGLVSVLPGGPGGGYQGLGWQPRQAFTTMAALQVS